MSDISIISAILVVIVAFLAGMEGILDQFQFHQPIVACTLIGLVTGNLTAGVVLGGTLQLVALGWANIGAAVAPDAALASVAAAIILQPNVVASAELKEEIWEYCAKHLVKHECPTEIYFVEAFPLNPTNKIIRPQLSQMLAKQRKAETV